MIQLEKSEERSIYDYVPLKEEWNKKFLDILDSISIGECTENTDLEREAKLLFMLYSLKQDDTPNYVSKLVVGQEFIYGYNNDNRERLVCICQAHKVLFRSTTHEIELSKENTKNIKFISRCIEKYTEYLLGRLAKAGVKEKKPYH